MKLPLFYSIDVSDDEVKFFNNKLDEYKLVDEYWINSPNQCATFNGKQTHNVLLFNDDLLIDHLDTLSLKFQELFEIKFEYHWTHFIEYDFSGYQQIHNHSHNEDFSFVLYLNDCKDGETVFHLNEKRNISAEVKPEKGNLVFFHSSLNHYAKVCTENKRVMVCGLRLLT